MKQWMRGGRGITDKDQPSSGAVQLQRHFQTESSRDAKDAAGHSMQSKSKSKDAAGPAKSPGSGIPASQVSFPLRPSWVCC